MRILSFIVRVAVEDDNVDADRLTDDITEVLREQLPDGDVVANCLVDTKLIYNENVTYSDGVK